MDALARATAGAREGALEVLLAPGLGPIVDMVGWSDGDDTYEVASTEGGVRYRRAADAASGYVIESVTGQNPLAVQDETRFAGLAAERATPHPIRQSMQPRAARHRASAP